MIPLTLIGGYLGTGKTTLLNHILKQNNTKRFALLINDFGDINIDASLIESKTDKQINLSNGCVCCSLSDGFHTALGKLLENPPEHIIVEASGVASINKLVKQCEGPDLQLDSIIIVADAETVQDKTKDKFVSGTVLEQLRSADLILLNKIDLIKNEALNELTVWLKSTAPDAHIVPSIKCDIPMTLFLETKSNNQRSQIPSKIEETHHHLYKSLSHASELAVSTKQISNFLSNTPTDLIRGKGILGLESGGSMLIHIVGKRQEQTRVKWQTEPKTQFVALGLAATWSEQAIQRWLKRLE